MCKGKINAYNPWKYQIFIVALFQNKRVPCSFYELQLWCWWLDSTFSDIHIFWKSMVRVIWISFWYPMHAGRFLISFPVVKWLFSYISINSFQRNKASGLPLEAKSIWYKKPHFHLKNTMAAIRFWFTLVHWIIHSSLLFISAEMISSLINFR